MFEAAVKMVLIVSKPKTFSEFVSLMAAARPLDQDPARLKKAWSSR